MSPEKWIIRTSDRKHFKECRRAWDLGSKIRRDLEPIKPRQALDFGTAVHKGLEVYYDPASWQVSDRSSVEAVAIATCNQTTREQQKLYMELAGIESLSPEDEDDFAWRLDMGPRMLRNYFTTAPSIDYRFKPVYVEKEFEVPIPVPPRMFFHNLPNRNAFSDCGPDKQFDGFLHFDRKPVMYQGRVDSLWEDLELGGYWIVDHKTVGQMREDMSYLELDEQCGSYAWALRYMLGLNIHGVIYNQLYKGAPDPPTRNKTVRKGCSFSVSKQQDTSYDLFLATVQSEDAAAYKAGYYDEYLAWLKSEGRQYFRRIPVRRSVQELDALGHQICLEAIDMLNYPYIYPHPTNFNCTYCDFRSICLMMNDGSDWEWMTEVHFRKRTNA